MEIPADLTMKTVMPYCSALPGRATVLASDATEEQLGSGIVIPTVYQGDDGMLRGVILDVTEAGTPIERGTVVFYRRGIKIGDVTVVDLADIIAYQAD